MPVYFIDTYDDEDLLSDEVGRDVPDLAAAGASRR